MTDRMTDRQMTEVSDQTKDQARDDRWQQTACILCSINCGIEVRLDGRRFERIRGDKAHPGSQGYTCEKALRLDHYQNGGKRLTSPLRRRADGTFEEIDWDTAIAEVAERFATIRDTHGGASILYYGGAAQVVPLAARTATPRPTSTTPRSRSSSARTRGSRTASRAPARS